MTKVDDLARAEPVIEVRDVADLELYAGNPKQHPESQLMLLERSIREFGWTTPVLVDKNDVVIAGHGRIEAARRLGMDRVPTIRLDHLTPEQARAYRIADNRLTELGPWDAGKLVEELDELKLSGYEVDLTGYTLADLGRMRPPDEKADDAPEPPAEPVTRPGDVWTLGRSRLVCGDSTDVDVVARVLDGNRPSLMVTDPPFGVNFDPEWRVEAAKSGRLAFGEAKRTAYMAAKEDTTIDWRTAWALSPATICYIYLGYMGVREQANTLIDLGWELRRLITWKKQHPVITRGPYASQAEHVWYAVRKGSRADWIGPKSTTDVWEIMRADNQTSHGAEKPLECMERPIRNHSGDVYEPFSGSGTTLIAAERQERSCYAIELDPRYVDVAVERWEDYTGGKAERRAAT